MRSHRISISFKLIKHVPIAKTRSYCFWHDYSLSKHIPIAKYWFVCLLKAGIISVIVRCYVLVFLGGPQVPKIADTYQEIAFYVMKQKPLLKPRPIAFGMITICQNTFPSLLPLFCNGNVFLTNWKCRKYWEKSLWKHGLIAKNAQKCT